MLALVVYAFVAQIPSELVVRVDPLEADVCDLEARIPKTLAETLRGVQILRETSSARIEPQKDRMRLVAFVRAIGVHFELFDDAGNSVLAREVPNPPDACPGTADGIAVIVERYLRDLGYEPGPVALPPIEPPAVRTSTRAAPTVTTTIARPPPLPEPERSRSFEVALGLGLSTFAGGIDPTSNLLWTPIVGARLRIGLFEAALDLGGIYRRSLSITNPVTTAPVGSLDVYSLFALAGGGLCASMWVGRGCLTLKGGVEWMHAKAFPNPGANATFHGFTNTPTALGGGEVRFDLPLFWRVALSPNIGAIGRIDKSVFDDAFKPSTWILTFGLGVWVRL